MAKFAEGTSTSVAYSKTELEKIVKRFGASKFLVAVDSETSTAAVQFFINDRMVRLSIELPPGEDKAAAAEERRRWRSLVALVKAKLVAVDDGIVEMEREFLGNVVTSTGETVYDRVRDDLRIEYQTGKPQHLLLGAP